MKCKLSFYLRFTLIHPCAVGVVGAFRRNMYGRGEESRGSQEQVAGFSANEWRVAGASYVR